MITEKDREEACLYLNKIFSGKPGTGSWHGIKDKWTESELVEMQAERDVRIRTESAEQARKEAAERICKRCPFGTCEDKDFCRVRASILDYSVVIEPLTSDANKKDDYIPDSEKLAIAVKALEEILYRHGLEPGVAVDCCHIANNALKEIQ